MRAYGVGESPTRQPAGRRRYKFMLRKGYFFILVCILLAGCKSGPKQQTKALKPFAPPDSSVAASIAGVVKFSGAPPAPQKIDMSQDPACGAQPEYDDSLVVTNGDLANVFVYVKSGLGDFSFTPPAQAATLAQKNCRYDPHVLAAMVGQTIEIVNDDPTTHNIHPMPKQSRQWNESQPPQGAPIEKKFDHPEIMIPVECNQHPWMHMYLNVASNPFFAVTGKDGRFEIHGLPPGTYTLAAVHEKLGEQDATITVAPKETNAQNFTFSKTP